MVRGFSIVTKQTQYRCGLRRPLQTEEHNRLNRQPQVQRDKTYRTDPISIDSNT